MLFHLRVDRQFFSFLATTQPQEGHFFKRTERSFQEVK
jgi:hypothetical protein